MDLASCSVFLDFDGTMTLADTGVHLLERVGAAGWREIDELYAAGAIGSRECLEREWELLPKDPDALRTIAAEVPLDPGFEALLADLRAGGAEVVVVSDGFGFYAEEVCARFDLPLITNAVDWSGRLAGAGGPQSSSATESVTARRLCWPTCSSPKDPLPSGAS